MLRHICVVTLLLLVQRCGAQPACPANDKTKCTADLHTVADTCTSDKCVCAPGYSPNADKCELSKPKISGETPDKKYYVGSSYSLVCNTDVTAATTFEWSNAAQKLSETKKTLTINDAKTTDSGSYSCKIVVGTEHADSEAIPVTVVAPGKLCAGDTECTGSVFSGKCDLPDKKRCVCAENYVVKEDTCKNGAAVISTSLLMLVVAIFSQLMKLS
ncbi:unnamed protein product [Lymnaea stagnalis]|uniref:Ig-like domain-containing protein n=1 Tax=Lymnaea stagnalis TaxID=6523 RepID=A0AAV2INX4_LYMST